MQKYGGLKMSGNWKPRIERKSRLKGKKNDVSALALKLCVNERNAANENMRKWKNCLMGLSEVKVEKRSTLVDKRSRRPFNHYF